VILRILRRTKLQSSSNFSKNSKILKSIENPEVFEMISVTQPSFQNQQVKVPFFSQFKTQAPKISNLSWELQLYKPYQGIDSLVTMVDQLISMQCTIVPSYRLPNWRRLEVLSTLTSNYSGLWWNAHQLMKSVSIHSITFPRTLLTTSPSAKSTSIKWWSVMITSIKMLNVVSPYSITSSIRRPERRIREYYILVKVS